MNTFDDLRIHLDSELSANPEFSLDSSELTKLGQSILNGFELDPTLLKRIQLLLSKDSDGRFICFNIEAVEFGILSGRDNGRNLTDANWRQLAMDSDIQHFIRDNDFEDDFDSFRDRKNKFIQRSQRLSKRVLHSLNIPIGESEFTLGRNDMCMLSFVSSETFLQMLFVCKKTKKFSKYGSQFMKLHAIYENVKAKYTIKANKSMKKMIEKEDYAITKRGEVIEVKPTENKSLLALIEEMRKENREGHASTKK